MLLPAPVLLLSVDEKKGHACGSLINELGDSVVREILHDITDLVYILAKKINNKWLCP